MFYNGSTHKNVLMFYVCCCELFKNELNKNKMKNTKEPNYRTEKELWMLWNMAEYGNDIKTAYQLLRQKEIVGSF